MANSDDELIEKISGWGASGQLVDVVKLLNRAADIIRIANKKDPYIKDRSQFWLAEIVKDGELPPTWGLKIIKPNGGLVTKQEAPLNPGVNMTRTFMAALCRAAHKQSDQRAIELAQSAIDKTEAEITNRVTQQLERSAPRLAALEKLVISMGLKDEYFGEDKIKHVGEAYKFLEKAGLFGTWNSVHDLFKRITEATEKMGAALKDHEHFSYDETKAAFGHFYKDKVQKESA